MKSHVRVVVVGGGVVGVNILYALAKKGWSDVVLLERRELTSGSTWHAAGLMSIYSTSYYASKLYMGSHEVYAQVEAETGQSVGFHRCGTLRLASTKDRLDEYLHYVDIADSFGAKVQIVGPADVRRLWPLVEKTSDLEGALYHPEDGHAAPADVTQALARGARLLGAEIHRQTEVTGIERASNGEWRVKTAQREIVCEHVVLATGSFARQNAAMLGLDIPVVPVVHQYLVTEDLTELLEGRKNGSPEMPILRDDTVPGYIREEGRGLMFGPYDENPPLWAPDGVPADYSGELLAPDIDATLPHFERAVARVPRLGMIGVKTCVSGPIAISPDNRPLVGPAWDHANLWLAEGFTGGIAMGGGIGRALAEWIVEGEPGIDLHEFDPRRFGAYANKRYASIKSREAFGNNFGVNFPDWEWPAARPLKTSPCYDVMARRGAVFGATYGWEIPRWFAPEGAERKDHPSYRRSNAFEPVREECRAARERVGLYDLTSTAKYELSGKGAAAWLDRQLATRLPRRKGEMGLGYVLTPSGGVLCEFTVTRVDKDRFYLVGSTAAERHHFDVLAKALPPDANVTLRNVTATLGAFAVVGPQARELLASLTDADLSNAAFPWCSARRIAVGLVSDILALRTNYVGELGWELHHPLSFQNHLLTALLASGKAHGLSLVGSRAVEALRMEKSYPALWRDLTAEHTLVESGLSRFIDAQKPDFVGREALLKQSSEGVSRRLVVLRMASGEANPYQNETVYRRGKPVGRITSAAHAHSIGDCLAHAFVAAKHAVEETEVEVAVLGERRHARIVSPSPWDPRNLRPRA
ncbi:MAG: FAD-dependent oxidoreductase [Hyphomicrobiales bacterium]|nr:FAD-dependent oxidoreductase [Hyphomicrobiales bacterium]